MSAKKLLHTKARRLAAKFVAEAQQIFDDERMTDAIYDSDVMQALLLAQQEAELVAELDA